MTPLDQRQRQRMAAIRQRANDQHRCEPQGIKEDVERRVGLRVFDDSLFLLSCLEQLQEAEFNEKISKRIEKIRESAQAAVDHDRDGVARNQLAAVRLGVFADHDFLVGQIDQVTEGRYKHDRSDPDPDAGPPPLNVDTGVVAEQEEGIPA